MELGGVRFASLLPRISELSLAGRHDEATSQKSDQPQSRELGSR